jgi:alpha-galactosidase
VIEKSWHLAKNANMWRMTDDFWDDWAALARMFERCEVWCRHVRPGCWPDCDMLPLGHIALNEKAGGRRTNFTRDEQVTMMTLWCMFRSPLMMGGEMRDNDDWTLSLLTNPEVLQLETDCFGADQLERDKDHAVWFSHNKNGGICLALFNLSDRTSEIKVPLDSVGLKGAQTVRDLWRRADLNPAEDRVHAEVPAHGAVLYRLAPAGG